MNSRKIFQLFLLMALTGASAIAADRTFDGSTSTSFNVATNWDGDTLPSPGDNLIIDANCVFDLTTGPQYGNLTINSGRTLTFSVTAPDSLKVVDVNGSGTITLGTGHLAITGSFDLTSLTFTSGSGRVEFAGTGSQTIPGTSYFDLFITGNRGMNVIQLADTINVAGVFDISGVMFDFGLPIFPDPGSTVNYNGSGAQTIATLQYENLVITARTGVVTFPIDLGGPVPTSIQVSGTLSLLPGATTYSTAGSTVVFNGSVPQSVPTTGAFDYFNLIILNTASVSFTGSYRVSGNFSAPPIAINPNTSTFDFNGTSMPQQILGGTFYDLTITGTSRPPVILTDVITIQNAFTIGGGTTFAGQGVSGDTLDPMAEVVYAGVGAQTVLAIPYQSLRIEGDRASATVTFSSSAPIGIAKAFTDNATNVTYDTSLTTFNYNGNGAQTITPFDYYNLTVSGARGTNNVTFGAGVTTIGMNLDITGVTFSSGSIVCANGSTIDYSSGGNQTVVALNYDNLVLSGFRSGATIAFESGKTTAIRSAFSVTATVVTWTTSGSTILLNGMSTTQTIPDAIPYDILSLSGSAQKEVGLGSVSSNTLNLMGASVAIQPSFNLTTNEFSGDNMSSIVFADGTAGFSLAPSSNVSFGGVFQGPGSILKQGTGTLTLTSGSTLFSGTATLSVGSLQLNVGNALGTGTIQANSGTLIINNVFLTSLVQAAGGTVRGQGNAGGSVKVSNGSVVNLEVINGMDVLSVQLMSQPGPSTANFSGPGRLVLLDNPTPGLYFNGVLNVNSGTAQLNSQTALGQPFSSVFVSPTAKLASNSAQPIPQGILMVGGELGATGADGRVFAGPITVSGPTAFQLRDILNPAQPRSFEIAGLISGPGPLSVSGPPASTPKLRLSGFLSSATNVGPSAELEITGTGSVAGTLLNIGTGAILTTTTNGNFAVSVNLATGALLRGTGGFQDTSSVTSVGGVLEPGPLTGTGTFDLSTGMGSPSSLSLDGATITNFDLSTPGSSDRIQVSGSLVLDGTLFIRPTGSFVPGTYTLFTHGGLTNNVADIGGTVPPGYLFALDTTTVSNEVRLVATGLPLAFGNPNSAAVTLGDAFTFPIAVNGPQTPAVTVTNTALPPGLRRNGLLIEGTPTQVGTYPVTLTAANGITSATQVVTITVNEPVQSGPMGPFAAEGRVGFPFFFDIADFVEDTSNNVFTSTALPEGLRLTGSVVSGTPKVAGVTQVTITGTDTTDGTVGTAIVDITILAKTETLGPVLSDLIIDPEVPGINEIILFSITASHPENLPVTVTWDFGDGTTASGDFVEKTFTAGNTYTVAVTATAGGKSTTLTKALTVSSIDPNAPVISDFVATPSPSVVGQLVTFTATSTDLNGDTVTLDWDFGDGQSTAAGNSVTFIYNTAGKYSVSVVATDTTGLKSRTTQFLHFVGKGTGVSNDLASTEKISFDGVSQRLNFSEDGLIGLIVSETGSGDAFSRADMEADTDFGIPGRRAVKGGTPSAQFTKSMLSVAKTTIREKATRKERGKARKTIGISARETKEVSKVESEPDDKNMNAVKLKGNFFPSRSAGATDSLSRDGAGSRATPKDALKADSVTASGSIMMPAGLDMSEGTEVEVALGNIIDKIVIDAKGKGKGKFTSLQMRIKTDKASQKSIGNVAAKFSIKMSVAEMIDNGFDTEGIVVSKDQSGKDASIQCAMLIGGVTYYVDNPVTLKVAPKEDKASMVTRRVKAE